MKTKEMIEKIDTAIDAIRIAKTLLVGIDTLAVEEIKTDIEKVYSKLIIEWSYLRKVKKELLK